MAPRHSENVRKNEVRRIDPPRPHVLYGVEGRHEERSDEVRISRGVWGRLRGEMLRGNTRRLRLYSVAQHDAAAPPLVPRLSAPHLVPYGKLTVHAYNVFETNPIDVESNFARTILFALGKQSRERKRSYLCIKK